MIDTSNINFEDDDEQAKETTTPKAGEAKVEKPEGPAETANPAGTAEGEQRKPGDESGSDESTTQRDKRQYTPQEKINFSFSKMKKKHREEVELLNRRIAEQQKIIDEFNGKKRDDYPDEDAYLDAKLDYRDAKRAVAQSENERMQLEEAQNAEVMRERVGKLYPTEQLQQMYREVCELGQKNGAVEAMLGDATIRKYIFDSDASPLLIEAFCRKPELLQKTLEMADSRKGFYMYGLEVQLQKMVADAEAKAKAAQNQPQTTQPQQQLQQPQIPVVGKVANAGANKSGPVDDWASDDELFRFARK